MIYCLSAEGYYSAKCIGGEEHRGRTQQHGWVECHLFYYSNITYHIDMHVVQNNIQKTLLRRLSREEITYLAEACVCDTNRPQAVDVANSESHSRFSLMMRT